jgi:hypothetical protein
MGSSVFDTMNDLFECGEDIPSMNRREIQATFAIAMIQTTKFLTLHGANADDAKKIALLCNIIDDVLERCDRIANNNVVERN